jgi:hypothetical protein
MKQSLTQLPSGGSAQPVLGSGSSIGPGFRAFGFLHTSVSSPANCALLKLLLPSLRLKHEREGQGESCKGYVCIDRMQTYGRGPNGCKQSHAHGDP